MNRCKNCKHFKTFDEIENMKFDGYSNEHYISTSPNRRDGQCFGVGMNGCSFESKRVGNIASEKTLAFTEDYDQYVSVLVVSENFGCVMFEGEE